MRLLFFTTDGHRAFNGINAWLLGFLPALRDAGHTIRVVLFAWSRPEDCTFYPQLQAAGVDARVVFPMRYTEAAVRVAIAEAQQFGPDVFIANMVTPALLAAPQIRAQGTPVISVLHNDDDEYRAKARLPVDATVVISSGLRRLVADEARLTRCVPYGVALPRTTAHARHAGEPLRIVYHGRIAQPQKRVLEMTRALVAICRQRPDITADLYGSGPDEAALQALLAGDDAEGRVKFLGARPSSELTELLPQYHVAVLLSDFEGLGLSILEAMAAGLVPVCLRTATGLPDIIEDGRNGWFVTDRADSFATALTRLADEPATWTRLSHAARETVAHRFSRPAALAAWNDLFAEVVRQRPRAHAPATTRLPAVDPALAHEDVRHPGLARAWWRWLRFGPAAARRPW